MNRHSNIAIFIPHLGCPHRCAFCSQKTISGTTLPPDGKTVTAICTQAMREISDRKHTEIAFFGGSFTALSRDYLLELLTAAQPFLGEDGFAGIRISTRPDYISPEILTMLRQYGVTAIELGAQSMSDEVLAANERGHSADAVRNAAGLIRAAGFELGVQMMLGLYRSTPAQELETARQLIALSPDTARIYPVVILRDTALARLLQSGDYVPYAFDEAVELTAACINAFREAGVRLLKVGLHASELVNSEQVGGFYHPAFRELCEAVIYRKLLADAVGLPDTCACTEAVFTVPVRCLSYAIGQKKSNLIFFAARGISLRILPDATQIVPLRCISMN